MNFLNLQYFCVTAEELSFTRAAKRLFISQQSLSNHISRLEEEFGVVLFNRTQPVTLTEAGERLYRDSLVLLDQKKQMEKAMQDIRDFRRGELTIGASTSRSAVMLADILPQFHQKFPQIQLRLIEGTTKYINQMLYEGQADVNIGFAINDPVNVEEDLLHEERLVCAVPNSLLPLYQLPRPDTLVPGSLQPLQRFAQYPFLRMNRDSWLGSVFDRCCRDHQVSPRVVLETTSMTTLVSLCAVGMGAIVLPEIFVNRRAAFWNHSDWQESVSVFPLDYPQGVTPITISHLRGRYLSRAAAEFIRMAKEKFTY